MTAPPRLLNYTTTVPAGKTIAEVHALLVGAGASAVSSLYDDGRCTGLTFAIDTPVGTRVYRLPVNVEAVARVIARSGAERRYRQPEQAERTAWRIVKDWVEAQLALLRTEMASLDQVMLPYMLVGSDETAFDRYRQQAAAELGPGQ